MVSGKYLKDYEVKTVADAKGRLRRRSEYVGPLFAFQAEEGVWVKARRRFWREAALCGAAVLVPLLVNTPAIRCWYVMVPLVLALLPTGHLIHGGAAALHRRQLTRKERDTAASLAPWSLTLLILSVLSLAGQLAYALSGAYEATNWPLTLSGAALALGAGRIFALKPVFHSFITVSDGDKK